MKTLKSTILSLAAVTALGLATVALAQKAEVGESISAEGQSLHNSEGTWTLTKAGETKSGLAVRLNGKGVGYAVTLTMGHNGLPIAKHADGKTYVWTGSTFKLEK
jgi:hypothetical protein